MYTITIGKNKSAAVEVYLDTKNVRQPNPSAIPPSVALGTGDKKKRYKEYLSKCFNDNSKLLNYLAFLHKTAKEKGSITLIARHALHKVHAEGIKEFLEENKETLDAILPYVFPGEGYKAPTDTVDAKVKDEFITPSSTEEFTDMKSYGEEEIVQKGQITAMDLAHIKDLIRQDQERERATSVKESDSDKESAVSEVPSVQV